MKRGGPLRRKAPDCPACVAQGRTICTHRKKRSDMKPRKPLRKSNPERREKLYERNFGDHAAVVRKLPCVGCYPKLWAGGMIPQPRLVDMSDPAHAKSRGAGGDKTDLFPACRLHHQMWDEHSWEWKERFPHLDPHEIAAAVWSRYSKEEDKS